jgi:hypothetical protein
MALEQSRSAKSQENEMPAQKQGCAPVNPKSVPAGGKIYKCDLPNVSGEHGAGSIGNTRLPYRITKGK